VAINWKLAGPADFDPIGAADLFSELGFHALTNQMRERAKADMPEFTHRYETIATAERLEWLIGELTRQKTNLDRHGDHELVSALGGDCRLFVRLGTKARRITCRFALRPEKCRSIRNRHWKHCGRCWKIRRSKR